jgi:hypothetical protein
MKNLSKIIRLILIISLLSCSEKPIGNKDGDMVCGTTDPIRDLMWLNKEYNGREVIEVQNSLFSSTNIHQYYCDGERLKLEEPGRFDEFKKNRIEKKVIYGTKLWN